jgi:hypothetical protein
MEERRRRNRALMAARKAVHDAENQGPEQQRIAAKALEDAEKELGKPYWPTIDAGRPPLN